jgi:hypothetical protein
MKFHHPLIVIYRTKSKFDIPLSLFLSSQVQNIESAIAYHEHRWFIPCLKLKTSNLELSGEEEAI